MISERALLLDVGPERRLCSALETILDPHFQVDIVREPAQKAAFEGSIAGRGFRDIIRRFDPLVIFLILPPDLRDNGRILETVRKETLPVPIIAVVEGCEPQRVFELIRAGAADFITTPLNATDVLPRTWRLVRRPSDSFKQDQLPPNGPRFQQMVGESPNFLLQLQKIPLIARCDANVLMVPSGERV